jgi:hypothetical protein
MGSPSLCRDARRQQTPSVRSQSRLSVLGHPVIRNLEVAWSESDALVSSLTSVVFWCQKSFGSRKSSSLDNYFSSTSLPPPSSTL